MRGAHEMSQSSKHVAWSDRGVSLEGRAQGGRKLYERGATWVRERDVGSIKC
jgi:hypothetical protein